MAENGGGREGGDDTSTQATIHERKKMGASLGSMPSGHCEGPLHLAIGNNGNYEHFARTPLL